MKEGIIIKKSYELYRTDEGQREIIHHIKSDTFLTVTSNEELKKILEAKKIYFVVQNIRGKDRKSPRIYISNGGKNNWDCNSDYEITRYKYFFPFIGQVKSIEPINQYELAEKMVSLPEDDFPLFDGGMLE